MMAINYSHKQNGKIALLINSLGSGGAQRQIIILANELATAGFETHLVFYDGDSHLRNELVRGVLLHQIDMPNQPKVKRWCAAINTLRSINPTHLISFIHGPARLAWIYKLFFSGKLFWLLGERNLENYHGGLAWAERIIVFRSANCIVANSLAQKNFLAKTYPAYKNKISQIPNAIRAEFFSGTSGPRIPSVGSKIKIVCFARLSKQKNPTLLLDALEKLSPGERAVLQIDWYGHEEVDGYSRDILNKQALSNNLPIRFLPSTSDVLSNFVKYHALLLCSLSEGVPNVVLEAMATNTLVVASDVSDVPGLLDFGGRGLLFQSGNSTRLAEKLGELISLTPAEWRAKTDGSYSYARSVFSQKSMMSAYVDLLLGRSLAG